MPDREPPTKARGQLAAELKRLHSMSGLTAPALAGAVRIGRATVFRIHNGESVPSMRVVRAWLDATEADQATRARVLEVAERVHTETVPWGSLIGGRSVLQEDIEQAEREAIRIRTFEPTVIPGLLQAPDYTRWLMPVSSTGQVDPERAVAGRLRRQALLREPGRAFEFLVMEAVLLSVPADVAEVQSRWMLELAALPAVELRVVPSKTWVATPWHNFAVHDQEDGSRFVALELVHGAMDLHADEDVAWYLRLWDRLWDAAARGDDAVRLIRQAMG